MNLQGLHHQIAQKRFASASAAADAARPSKDPHTAYELDLSAQRLAKEADDLTLQAQGNADMLQEIGFLINYLNARKGLSRYRTLALTDLESARNWLLTENGTGTSNVERSISNIEVKKI